MAAVAVALVCGLHIGVWAWAQAMFDPILRFFSYLPPLARIDYVFHNDSFQALAAHVLASSGGSDHRPLLAKLELTPAT